MIHNNNNNDTDHLKVIQLTDWPTTTFFTSICVISLLAYHFCTAEWNHYEIRVCMQITAGSSLSVNWRTWWDNNWQSNLKLAVRAGSSPYFVTLALRSFVSIKCINKRLIIPWKLCNRNYSQLHRVNTTIFLQNETRQDNIRYFDYSADWLTDWWEAIRGNYFSFQCFTVVIFTKEDGYLPSNLGKLFNASDRLSAQ